MELHIENPDLGYSKAKLIEPTSHGYIYVAAAVHPNKIPVVLPNTKRSKLLSHLKQLARELEHTEGVIRVAVFRAIVRPPTARVSTYLKEHGAPSHGANYDVLILIENDLSHHRARSPELFDVPAAVERHSDSCERHINHGGAQRQAYRRCGHGQKGPVSFQSLYRR
jgi:hypothetical protein